ncbi:MAG: peptidoglycan-binding protein LysM [Rhodospirillales bacterium]|nr:peptidoglycan-binding protein LysM [Rhodospirillales bacterium]
MGLFDFIKAAGHKLGIGGDDAPKPDDLKKQVADLGLGSDLDVEVQGDTVKVKGKAASQEEKEKIVLALGNVEGVAKVDEDITTPATSPGAKFYTVKKGDTLSAIAKSEYGDAGKYNAIFEANKPMLDHPDKIYPGQVLRIPPVG